MKLESIAFTKKGVSLNLSRPLKGASGDYSASGPLAASHVEVLSFSLDFETLGVTHVVFSGPAGSVKFIYLIKTQYHEFHLNASKEGASLSYLIDQKEINQWKFRTLHDAVRQLRETLEDPTSPVKKLRLRQ